MVCQGRDSEEAETQQVEFLAVVQRGLVGQPVVHALVQVVQDQHVRPRVLQQLHLVVHLQQTMGRIATRADLRSGNRNVQGFRDVIRCHLPFFYE